MFRTVLLTIVFAGVCAAARAQEDYEVLRAIARDGGAQPMSALIRATDGNFYGGSTAGIYRLTQEGGYSVLAELGGVTLQPVQASDGNLYVLQPTRIVRVALDGTPTPIRTHTNASEGDFIGALVEGNDGNLYGFTTLNGEFASGTAFRISFDGAYTTLRSLLPSEYEKLRIIRGRDGVMYGRNRTGGVAGAGTIFRMNTDGTLAVLYTFTGGLDGKDVFGGLVHGSDGYLYGTTRLGGAHGAGTFFRVGPDGAFAVLYDLKGRVPGGDSITELEGSLIEGSDGHFYGATEWAIFRLTLNGTSTLLHDAAYSYPSWAGPNRYGWGLHGVIEGADGNFYGSGRFGAPGNNGVLFRLKRQRSACANELKLQWQPFNDGSGTGTLYSIGVVKTETPALIASWLLSAAGSAPLSIRVTPPITPTFAFELAQPFHESGPVGIFALVVTAQLSVCPAWATADTGGAAAALYVPQKVR